MKKILGLDLGTTSIGWAFIKEAEHDNETSSITNTGVRIVPLTTDEEADFKKGNTISINADRTLKRGARRGLQRFKQRRTALLQIFRRIKFITSNYIYAETGKQTTFSSYKVRAKAATEKVTKEELIQVLLMINKKRGYKSSRKAKTPEEGTAIDGMKIAKEIFENKLTPGQWVFDTLSKGRNYIPDFYRSDLQKELEQIINFQSKFYPDIINKHLVQVVKGKSKNLTSQYFTKTLKIELAENKGSRDEIKLQHYKWRNESLVKQLDLQIIAFVITEINNQINQSSGYLGAISDRSKELYFNNQTVGQFQYNQLEKNPHTILKNQVFYRQDYLDEFEKIWETQAQFHPELDDKLKSEIRDITIFYQRKLKSQKHLISHCEFEKGHKVIPKSSPLFQEFRIWQNINNIEIKENKTVVTIPEEIKREIADELEFREDMTDIDGVKFLIGSKDVQKGKYSINFKKIEGNRTNAAIFKAFEKIIAVEGYDLDFDKMNYLEIKEAIYPIFKSLNIDTNLLSFDASIQGDKFDKQPYYQFWHLLYSSEEDSFIKKHLMQKYGFSENHVPFLLNITLQSDYGSLSSKAIKKILPHLKDGHLYDKACLMAGYNHSSSLTKDDNDSRVLKDTLSLLKKNSLRNPVVEKILNQMINVINTIINDPNMGKPDEIRVELARELKANNEQREKATKEINKATLEHQKIRAILSDEFKIHRVTRNDIIRYRLWEECGKISIYTGNPIKASDLFTKEYDIEHIIPKSRLFDDSFSNKTLCERELNIEKSNKTAFSFLQDKYSPEKFIQFEKRVKSLFGKISYTKSKKLLMSDDEIPNGFIERQLKETQYIAKKAKDILFEISKNVSSTIGNITDKLREDWELIDVMQELNWDKYNKLGLTYEEKGKNGERLYKIKDWTKRNDHRHHAMDAITVAFTKPVYIQYLNNLNARSSADDTKSNAIKGIENKYLERDKHNKLRFLKPIKNFREEAKKHLENILVSYKAKNKVVTNNVNRTKVKNGINTKIQLTPRGQLHKETIYGSQKKYVSKEIPVNGSLTLDQIEKVTKIEYKEALLKRLSENANDPKKAFSGKNSILKMPIYISLEKNIIIPEKVKIVWFENQYTIRKNITPDNFKDFKNIEKVVDSKIRKILENRLKEYGDAKKAFGNLIENPIWLNKEKGIAIKSATITGVSNAQALHTKKDHLGNEILNSNGKSQAVDFVSTGNNHHVAIYKDEKGNLQEEVVSFYDAVIRKNLGLSVIDKNHEKGWEFLFTMKQNEFFIFPTDNFNPNEINLLNPQNYHLISPNIFRVQKISTKNYMFNNHLETKSVDGDMLKNKKQLAKVTYNFIQTPTYLENIIKVRINHIGKIVQLGEY